MRPRPQQQKQQPPPLFGKPNLRTVVSAGTAAAAPGQKAATAAASKAGNNSDELPHCPPIPGAVGTEYVVQIRTRAAGRAALQYHCRLCNCRFIDVQRARSAREAAVARMQYKRKVDPRISVDAAQPGRQGATWAIPWPQLLPRLPSETAIEAANRRRREEEQRLRHMQELEWSNFIGCKPGGMWGGGVGQPRRSETSDDRQVLAKHSASTRQRLSCRQYRQLVTRCERALKLASDHLSFRVGCSAATSRCNASLERWPKGLLLHGDLATQLVLLCATWPSRELRNRVVKLLPERLATSPDGPAESSTDEPRPDPPQLQVRLDEDEDCISVHQLAAEDGGLELTCSIYLNLARCTRARLARTAPSRRTTQLDRDKCLEALAALRQAKPKPAVCSPASLSFGYARHVASGCRFWAPLPNWAVELLVERCISSAEAASWCLQAKPFAGSWSDDSVWPAASCCQPGPGLRDPCEKLPV
uniref:DZF domain-containing protein n=1 Tax=Macrostomum lignano TaxID=282301 RepID=A0A1I8FHC0_9PLAT